MLKRFRVELLRDAYVRYETEVEAESADAAWATASAYDFNGTWERGEVIEFDHTERGEIEETAEKDADHA